MGKDTRRFDTKVQLDIWMEGPTHYLNDRNMRENSPFVSIKKNDNHHFQEYSCRETMGFLSFCAAIKPRVLEFTGESDKISVSSNMTESGDESANNNETPGTNDNSTPGSNNVLMLSQGRESGSTAAGNQDVRYLERELQKLRQEKQEMIDRETAIITARDTGQSMSRVFGRMPTYQGQDQINYGPVNKLAREMFVEVKHLEKSWNVQSDDKRSMYQRIIKCSGVTVPDGWNEYAYFQKVLARVYVTKYRTMRTNFITFCREAYLGKT